MSASETYTCPAGTVIAYRHIRTISAVVTHHKQALRHPSERHPNDRSSEILYRVAVQGRDEIEVMFMGSTEEQLTEFKGERLQLIELWQAWLKEHP